MNIYQNVMELLVEQEVDRQLKALPPKVASYINRLELVAYALNQLPALYATSEQGLKHQMQRGMARHGVQVAQAVQRAIAAIRRDPLRSYAPLQAQQSPMLQDVLYQLRRVLKNERLNWETIPVAVEEALTAPQPGRFTTLRTEAVKAVSAAPSEPSVGASSYAAHHLRANPQRSLSPFPEASGVFVPPPAPAPTAPPAVPPRASVRPRPAAGLHGATRPAPRPETRPAAPPPDSPPTYQSRYLAERRSEPRPVPKPERAEDGPDGGWDTAFFR